MLHQKNCRSCSLIGSGPVHDICIVLWPVLIRVAKDESKNCPSQVHMGDGEGTSDVLRHESVGTGSPDFLFGGHSAAQTRRCWLAWILDITITSSLPCWVSFHKSLSHLFHSNAKSVEGEESTGTHSSSLSSHRTKPRVSFYTVLFTLFLSNISRHTHLDWSHCCCSCGANAKFTLIFSAILLVSSVCMVLFTLDAPRHTCSWLRRKPQQSQKPSGYLNKRSKVVWTFTASHSHTMSPCC